MTLIAAGSLSPLVQDLGMCIVASALFGVIFERLRIPTIAALLGAGVLVGPIGLTLVHSQANIDTIASLGLTLLLFVIGLEVNPVALFASGRTLVVSGALQVPLTLMLATGVFASLRALDWTVLSGPYVALYLGAACAFSSTLLVVKLLQERRKLDSVSGRYCVGLLIFQDVWAIVFLALQPSFEEPKLAPILLTFLGIAVIVGIAYVVARWVLPLAFRIVAKIPELVVTVALGWCFGLGLLGVHLGEVVGTLGASLDVSVSMEMCALIAGASLAASPYTHEVVGKVSSLRDFFVTLFFVGLGMGVPVPDGADVVWLALVLSVVAVALRYAVFLPLLYATGLDRRHALETATKLAQVSEFCLVIAYLGQRFGHLDAAIVSATIFAFVVTALLTPLLFAASDRLYDVARPLLDLLGFRAPTGSGQGQDDQDAPRIVMLGFHRIAAALLHDLEREHPELLPSIQVVDFNVAIHDGIRSTGARVVYGDVASPATLQQAGVAEAELVISTVPDELLKKTSNAVIAQMVRAMNENAVIITHATRIVDVEAQLRAGADDVFLTSVESAVAM
ncbi:MAG: cation:proton antiporter, partial [Deltaproteobacteria bacterium]|nr:cation:proton antiporter [Nannocystaceae bacterium]